MFWTVKVIFERPYVPATPMGITRVTVEGEVEAPSADAARRTAIAEAITLHVAHLDNVTNIRTEIR